MPASEAPRFPSLEALAQMTPEQRQEFFLQALRACGGNLVKHASAMALWFEFDPDRARAYTEKQQKKLERVVDARGKPRQQLVRELGRLRRSQRARSRRLVQRPSEPRTVAVAQQRPRERRARRATAPASRDDPSSSESDLPPPRPRLTREERGYLKDEIDRRTRARLQRARHLVLPSLPEESKL